MQNGNQIKRADEILNTSQATGEPSGVILGGVEAIEWRGKLGFPPLK